jgi:hypothetical protein
MLKIQGDWGRAYGRARADESVSDIIQMSNPATFTYHLLSSNFRLIHRLDRLGHHGGHCPEHFAVWRDLTLHCTEHLKVRVEYGLVPRKNLLQEVIYKRGRTNQ